MEHRYVVSYLGELLGVFSNRKIMMDNIRHLTENLHIQGSRKNLDVNEASVGTYMSSDRFIKLFDEEEKVVIRIWDINTNTLNPNYKESKK